MWKVISNTRHRVNKSGVIIESPQSWVKQTFLFLIIFIHFLVSGYQIQTLHLMFDLPVIQSIQRTV